MNLGVPFPIHLADPHDGTIPIRYVSLKRTQECSCCGRVHEWCELYAHHELKSTLGYKRVTHWRRLDWPKYRLPIEQLEDETTTLIPFCHDCNEPSLMNSADMLDPPPAITTPLHIIEPTTKTATKPKASAKPKATVDDLMEMLK